MNTKKLTRKQIALKRAYDIMLDSAKKKLARAIEKKNDWDIGHYTNDIKILEHEIKILEHEVLSMQELTSL